MHGASNVTAFEGPARRKETRRDVFWIGQISTPAGIHECRVLDLSPGGAKVKLSTFVWTSQTVTLTLDAIGIFTGLVAWRRNGCIGIAIREHRLPSARIAATRPAIEVVRAEPHAGLRGIRVGGPAWRAEIGDPKHTQ